MANVVELSPKSIEELAGRLARAMKSESARSASSSGGGDDSLQDSMERHTEAVDDNIDSTESQTKAVTKSMTAMQKLGVAAPAVSQILGGTLVKGLLEISNQVLQVVLKQQIVLHNMQVDTKQHMQNLVLVLKNLTNSIR